MTRIRKRLSDWCYRLASRLDSVTFGLECMGEFLNPTIIEVTDEDFADLFNEFNAGNSKLFLDDLDYYEQLHLEELQDDNVLPFPKR